MLHWPPARELFFCPKTRNYFTPIGLIIAMNSEFLKPIYWNLALERMGIFKAIIGTFRCSLLSDLPYTGRSAKTPAPTSDRCRDRRFWYTIILCCPHRYSRFCVLYLSHGRLLSSSRVFLCPILMNFGRKVKTLDNSFTDFGWGKTLRINLCFKRSSFFCSCASA